MRHKTTNPDLYALSRPIPSKYIKAKDGADYIPHYVIQQALLATVGPVHSEIVEILRGDVPEMTTKNGRTWPRLDNAIVGVVYRMSLHVDDDYVSVVEAGTCDAPAFIPNDAERLKRAISDAVKRCAMRFGVGLHLWCKTSDEYFLPDFLTRDITAELAAEGSHTEDGVVVVGVEHDENDPERPFE